MSIELEGAAASNCVCGIIMPISYSDDHHTEAHWKGVLGFVEKAIGDAGMVAQPVWHNADFDVIQARILQNLFENEIVVCDVSTRNPNVMLELGMRLTTKKPTIIIAEAGTKLPFDTSVINTEFYDPSLKYNEIADFVAKLTKILIDTRAATIAGTYRAYLELFKFETVQPANVTVTGEVAIAERLEEMSARIARISHQIDEGRKGDDFAEALRQRKFARIDPVVDALLDADDRQLNAINLGDLNVNPDITIGSKIFHRKFGLGVVVEIDGNKLEAEFDGHGRKRVMHSFVRLLDDPGYRVYT